VLKGVVAQRLVRRLCDDCAEPAPAESLAPDARPGPDWTAPVRLRRPVGCRACSGAGYRGRSAIMEIMLVDESVARLIDAGKLPDSIAQAARKAGFRTLWESGLERVWTGTTSIDELERVLGERVHDDATADPADPMTAVAAPQTGPAAGAVPASRLPAAAAEPGPGGTRILVADDDPQMRRLIRSVLTREGFEVVEAEDGLQALELIESGRIGLVVLDFEMPRLDGLGVLEELRAQMRTAGLPVIMLTSHAGETEQKALDLGAQDYLTKPVQTRSLVARVKAVLKRVQG
jgi:CheY-like chemotaxis protein